ncbi:MAG: hypothetical protein ABI472_18790 [Ginsengibacter sp.]
METSTFCLKDEQLIVTLIYYHLVIKWVGQFGYGHYHFYFMHGVIWSWRVNRKKRTKKIDIGKVLGAVVANISSMPGKDFLWLIIIAIIIMSPVAYYFQPNGYRILHTELISVDRSLLRQA